MRFLISIGIFFNSFLFVGCAEVNKKELTVNDFINIMNEDYYESKGSGGCSNFYSNNLSSLTDLGTISICNNYYLTGYERLDSSNYGSNIISLTSNEASNTFVVEVPLDIERVYEGRAKKLLIYQKQSDVYILRAYNYKYFAPDGMVSILSPKNRDELFVQYIDSATR